MIRLALHSDIDAIMRIVRSAQQALADLGIDQWQDGYPTRDIIGEDIARGVGYVATDDYNHPIGYAAILLSGEPAYSQIGEDRWNTPSEYVVVHRLCVDGAVRRQGVARQLMEFAMHHALDRGITAFRIDTHEGNVRMLQMLNALDFKPTGIISYDSGLRIAYDLNITDKL